VGRLSAAGGKKEVNDYKQGMRSSVVE
jgi:hypothetical protein